MDNQNQQIQTPQVPNQISPVNNNSSGLKIIPIGLGILFVLVAIGSYLMGTRNSQTVVSNQQNPAIPTTIPTPIDEIANWKTYSSTDYGFSLKYPQDYSISENTQNLKISGLLLSTKIMNPNPKPGGGYSQPYVEIVVYENDTDDLDSWIEKHTSTLPFDDPSLSNPNSKSSTIYRGVSNRRESALGGKEAITFQSRMFESSPNPTLTISGDYVIGLVLDNENETKDTVLKNLYPQILSTFQFSN